MRIEKISVLNFKGLLEAQFEPTNFACLVGENNAGKSTVLQSIVFAINRPTQMPIELHYDSTRPIEFCLQLTGIDDGDLARLADEHRGKIEELVVDGSLSIKVRYNPGDRAEIKVDRLAPIEPRYRAEAIAAALSGKRPPAVTRAVEEHYPEFLDGCPADANITTAKQHVTQRIKALPLDQFIREEAPLPSGVSASITALLPEAIYIPAVKNLSDDLKTTQSTSFGRLLGLLLEDMAPDLEAIQGSLKDLDALLNRVRTEDAQEDGRHKSVRDLEGTVEGFLRENFPGARVELEIPPPDLKTILNTAKIFVDDGSRDLIDNKGDGIKRALTFALLQCYVARLKGRAMEAGQPTHRPLIFLFEEPELYLHPRSQRVLFGTLAKIAEAHQVVVTTHSPLFFCPGVTATFVRVAKRPGTPKPVGVLHTIAFRLDERSAEAFRLTKFENADAAFFSRRIVLFEGESDDAFFKHIAKRLENVWDFDEKNIAMVRVSGKGNFAKFRRFFDSFGIEVKIVADLDAMFDGFEHLGAGEQINEFRGAALQQIDRRIIELGTKAEPSASQIRNRVGRQSFRARYEAAKVAVARVRELGTVDDAALESLDGLFVWEDDIARTKACRDDAIARAALTATVDALRELGICVLTRGSIEDYYPEATPANGSKPERAIAATELIASREDVLRLSQPIAAGRPTEIEEICAALFVGL